MSTPAKLVWIFLLCVVMAASGAIAYRTWPRPFHIPHGYYPGIQVTDGGFAAPMPAHMLLAEVGSFDNELSAYLWFDYLRGRPALAQARALLNTAEERGTPVYRIYLVVPNDALSAIPFLSQLEAQGYITGFNLVFSNPFDLEYRADQTSIFVATYQKPVQQELEKLSDKDLLPSVARFVLFKSRTDPRVRAGSQEEAKSLGQEQAADVAADIIAVSKFFDVPLDVFLGIGAMENNYLSIRGDLQNTAWKKKAAKDDIVLKRKRRRVLVSNYSIGAWQITRETLRYAHGLYLKDTRDYTQLPERLKPPQTLQFDMTDSHVLTTYAGLLLRDLLDKFDGDVQKAVGAYNGGVHNPNLNYAAGVDMVAQYARNILERGPRAGSQSITEIEVPATPPAVAEAAPAPAAGVEGDFGKVAESGIVADPVPGDDN